MNTIETSHTSDEMDRQRIRSSAPPRGRSARNDARCAAVNRTPGASVSDPLPRSSPPTNSTPWYSYLRWTPVCLLCVALVLTVLRLCTTDERWTLSFVTKSLYTLLTATAEHLVANGKRTRQAILRKTLQHVASMVAVGAAWTCWLTSDHHPKLLPIGKACFEIGHVVHVAIIICVASFDKRKANGTITVQHDQCPNNTDIEGMARSGEASPRDYSAPLATETTYRKSDSSTISSSILSLRSDSVHSSSRYFPSFGSVSSSFGSHALSRSNSVSSSSSSLPSLSGSVSTIESHSPPTPNSVYFSSSLLSSWSDSVNFSNSTSSFDSLQSWLSGTTNSFDSLQSWLSDTTSSSSSLQSWSSGTTNSIQSWSSESIDLDHT